MHWTTLLTILTATFLVTQRWFWIGTFFIGALVSFLAALACLYWPINLPGLLGLLFLSHILGTIGAAIAEGG